MSCPTSCLCKRQGTDQPSIHAGWPFHQLFTHERESYQLCVLAVIEIQFLSVCFCFVALRPKTTAMVMARRSVHLTFFLGKLEQAVNQYYVQILLLVTDNNPS